MNISKYIYIAGGNDVKLFSRDHFLIFMFLFALIIASAFRFLLPWLDGHLAAIGVMPGEYTDMFFSDVYPMIIPYMTVFTGGTLVGSIYGFMLLDERDDKTLISMMVTPIPLSRFVRYRIFSSILFAFVIIVSMLLIINVPLISAWQMVLIAAGGSLTAPIAALFYATVAENKVQGFAYGKFASIAGWTIIIGWFISDQLQWLFGLFPPFLVSKSFWMASEGHDLWWLALMLGILLQAALIFWMIRWFNKVVTRQ